ncbi:hypothetical protein AX16_005291 [Volvariella volvacea WC 439]|nr:hypothetical protein AX16_005291 [Volvariella volvacea WC 439]
MESSNVSGLDTASRSLGSAQKSITPRFLVGWSHPRQPTLTRTLYASSDEEQDADEKSWDTVPLRALSGRGHQSMAYHKWNDEIRSILIFATILAMTVTSFIVSSHRWYKKDFASEVTAQALAQISQRLAGLSHTTSGVDDLPNPHALSFQPEPPKPYTVSSADAGINIMWLLSLFTSLSTILIGVLCLRRLREYERFGVFRRSIVEGKTPQASTLRRHNKYAKLINCNIPQLIFTLLLLIQTSVILFFLGLFHFLYDVNQLTTIFSGTPFVLAIPFVLFAATIFLVIHAAIIADKGRVPTKAHSTHSEQAP